MTDTLRDTLIKALLETRNEDGAKIIRSTFGDSGCRHEAAAIIDAILTTLAAEEPGGAMLEAGATAYKKTLKIGTGTAWWSSKAIYKAMTAALRDSGETDRN